MEQIRSGDLVNLSRFTMSPHLGTHADAHVHVDDAGTTSTDFDLETFVGPAWVVDARLPERLQRIPASVLSIGEDGSLPAPRVLFRTDTHPDRTSWNPNFASLSVELAEELVRLGVQLIGIDTPGVDPGASLDLEVHQILRKAGVNWIEGLDLQNVAAGVYDLVALPLAIAGADASPLRAILMDRS